MRLRGWRRAAFAVVAATVLTGVAAPAHGQPAAPGPKIETYLITDPELVNNPARVTEALKRDGNLDALGIKPDPDNAARSIPRTAETEDPGYTVNSAEFDGPQAAGSLPIHQLRGVPGQRQRADAGGLDQEQVLVLPAAPVRDRL